MKVVTPKRLLHAALGLSLSGLTAATALSCSGSGSFAYKLAATPKTLPTASDLSFVLLSDTQYAVPFTDYDVRYQLGKQIIGLPPDVTTKWVTSFYRHAEAHFALPWALQDILQRERAQHSFGLFGGDMAEFSCRDETATIFNMLKRQKGLPLILSIGNHDALFHGSYDTDAVAEAGQGPWDLYSFKLWGSVCDRLGGRLTKAGFIKQLIDYYESAWGMKIHGAIGLAPDAEYPLGTSLQGTVATPTWELTFSFRLSAEDSPESHRQSFLYQRWTRRDRSDEAPHLTITVLDTTDYGSRSALCDATSKLVQIGLAGAISAGQVEWLEGLRAVAGPHIVLSHHLPFESVDGIDACETTLGTHCLGARLARVLPGATFVYGHVHRPFETETLKNVESCSASDISGKCNFPMVRLPSLIDNKGYVVFEKGSYQGRTLTAEKTFESKAPFSLTTNTCTQRFFEYVELERNIQCFARQRKKPSPQVDCPTLASIIESRTPESADLCNDLSSSWKQKHPKDWTAIEKGACNGFRPIDHWRCILRGLADGALANASLSDSEKGQLGTKLLGSVATLEAPGTPARPSSP